MIIVKYEARNKDDTQNLTIRHLPQLNITLNGTHAFVEIKNEDFQSCTDMKYELQCQDAQSGTFVSIRNFTRPIILVDEYMGTECRVRWDEWCACNNIVSFILQSMDQR